jgi:hypothetical protein
VETDVTAIRDVYLPYTMAGVQVHYFNLVRAVDDGIETITIYLDVVAYIAELFDDIWITFAVDIADINTLAEVEVVDSGFVATHIPLVEQVHANGFVLRKTAQISRFHRQFLVLRREDNLIATAGGENAKNKTTGDNIYFVF